MAIGDHNTVSPEFWKNLATEKVYDSFATRAKSVDSLQTFVKWFIGLFSSGSFLLLFFGKSDLGNGTLIVWGAGLGCLLVGSLLAMEAGFPRLKDIDLTDGDDIEEKYSEAIRGATKVFKWAFYMVTIGVFLVVVGILIEFGTTSKDAPHRLQVRAYLKKADTTWLMPFTLKGDKSSSVDVVISGTNEASPARPWLSHDTILLRHTFPTDSEGLYNGVFPLPAGLPVKFLRVTASALRKAGQDSLYDTVTQTVIPLP